MHKWFKEAALSMPGRAWPVHIVLWLCGASLFVEMVKSTTDNPSLVLVPISMLSFGLHELAHVVTSALPPTLCASAGSLSELLFGGVLVVVAYKKRAYITTIFATLWYLFASLSAGRYMADARSQLMPLVSVASALGDEGEVIHDWHAVFGRLGILGADTVIGSTVKGAGILLALSAFITYAYFIFLMTHKPVPPDLLLFEDELKQAAQVLYSQDPASSDRE